MVGRSFLLTWRFSTSLIANGFMWTRPSSFVMRSPPKISYISLMPSLHLEMDSPSPLRSFRGEQGREGKDGGKSMVEARRVGVSVVHCRAVQGPGTTLF
jgi:hypothetical protein